MDPYDAGYRAHAVNGKNPHAFGSEDFWQWDDGFDVADMDAQDEDEDWYY